MKISATIADNLSENRSLYLENKNLDCSDQLIDPVPLTQNLAGLYGVFTRILEKITTLKYFL
jgi:hypothetical protein